MILRQKICLALILSLGSMPALADTWLCNVNASTGHGVIGPEIAFSFDSASPTGRVIDGVIAELEGTARVADVVRSGNVKTLIWDISKPLLRTVSTKGTIQYRASLLPNNRLSVTANDLGAGKKVKARGTCKRTNAAFEQIGDFGRKLDGPLNRRW